MSAGIPEINRCCERHLSLYCIVSNIHQGFVQYTETMILASNFLESADNAVIDLLSYSTMRYGGLRHVCIRSSNMSLNHTLVSFDFFFFFDLSAGRISKSQKTILAVTLMFIFIVVQDYGILRIVI